jgi:C-terminal processing protease CtpA/Prc
VFESLQGAKGLIVDLRGNEGGNDCGDAIIARLIDRDIKRDRARRLVRAAKVPADLNPYLDTWDDGFRDWGDAAKPAGEGWFELLRGDETDGAIAPKGPRFRGKVVVLIDAANSSATFQFASAIRKNGLGTLLGGPTGGNRRGINGGAFFFVRLPETGLEADLPLIGYYPDASEPDEGLLPDIAVMRAAADLASGRDAVMERALAEAA